jgi:hypothetical protein
VGTCRACAYYSWIGYPSIDPEFRISIRIVYNVLDPPGADALPRGEGEPCLPLVLQARHREPDPRTTRCSRVLATSASRGTTSSGVSSSVWWRRASRLVWSAAKAGAVDASPIVADANKQRQTRAVADYLTALDEADEPDPDRKEPKEIAPSDPSSASTAKRVQFGYGLNYLIGIDNAVIVDVEARPARTYDEVEATKTTIGRTEQCFDLKPKRLAADSAYGSGRFIGWLVKDAKITPHITVRDKSERDAEFDVLWLRRRTATQAQAHFRSGRAVRLVAPPPSPLPAT